MLAIKRRLDERVTLTLPDGSTIEIVVMDVHKGNVKLGIHADRSIAISRPEPTEVAPAISRSPIVYRVGVKL